MAPPHTVLQVPYSPAATAQAPCLPGYVSAADSVTLFSIVLLCPPLTPLSVWHVQFARFSSEKRRSIR